MARRALLSVIAVAAATVAADCTAVAELRACPGVAPEGGPSGHGVAAEGREAAAPALNAGTDSEMSARIVVR